MQNLKRLLLLFIFLLLVACSAAPIQEMSDARQAVKAAHEAGAEQKAPEKLESAERALQAAEKKLTQRRYGEAREEALRARDAAIEAQQVSDDSAN